MKETTTIDAAARLVIPKRFRDRYGLFPGETVKFVAGDEGVTIVQERSSRRFIRRIPLLAIETGPTRAPLEAFDVLRRAGGTALRHSTPRTSATSIPASS